MSKALKYFTWFALGLNTLTFAIHAYMAATGDAPPPSTWAKVFSADFGYVLMTAMLVLYDKVDESRKEHDEVREDYIRQLEIAVHGSPQ